MNSKRIVLIGYPAVYFLPFAKRLEADGFAVYWICGLTSDASYLHGHGFGTDRVLDVNAGFNFSSRATLEQRTKLAEIESTAGPLINDLLMMDRILSKKSAEFAYGYLAHLQSVMEPFLASNRIELATSWRDTALQLLGMLVCHKQGIPWVVPTRIRIPQEVYGFCTAHHTDSFLIVRETKPEDTVWAESFLRTFESQAIRPGMKLSMRSFADILGHIPVHLSAFLDLLRRSIHDTGNDIARYPIGKLIIMYLRRRLNLLLYKVFNPSERPDPARGGFCLYALHTQPESSIDVQASYFSDQVELIRYIARSLPVRHRLYVKVHPTDVDGKSLAFYHRIREIPGVILVDYSVDSRSLLAHAAIVFALTGTIAYEAALLQKPVIVFARNFFNSLPTVHWCETPTALSPLIAGILSSDIRGVEPRSQIIAFLAKLRASCFDGEVSRAWGAAESLRASDLDQLQRAYGTIYRLLTSQERA